MVDYRSADRVAVLTIENPPVNSLNAEVQEDLHGATARAISDSAIDAMVIIGGGNTFAAGADLRQLERMARAGVVHSMLPRMLRAIESSPKPVIAAIHGNALGGGLELALAAHYRIAAPDAKVGQPEVKLGLIPGAGGTQRLPRLIGIEAALEMCVFGETVRAPEALRLGIIDRIEEDDLLASAVKFARKAVGSGPRRTRDVRVPSRDSSEALFKAYREKARKERRNLLAPAAAIEAVEMATVLPFEEGCGKEREIFERLLASGQARALIHVFFAERAAREIPGVETSSATLPIRAAVVIGAGTMGRGIAMCFANAGIPVLLKDTKEALDAAMDSIAASYQMSLQKGRISADEMQSRLSKIRPGRDYSGCETADIIIEAAFERMEVKQAVFAECSRVARPDAILATNTSYLNIDEIGAACSRPERLIGLHFFSPANVMRLLEVVPGRLTSPIVTATALALAKRLGKLAVAAGNCPGFIGNRMLRAYRREAQLLLEEGTSPRQVDSALEEWGMAMGPFAAQDLGGIDIAMSSRHVFEPLDRDGIRKPRVIDMLYRLGRLGQKTGAGWCRYEGNRTALPDPDVDTLIERAARERGIVRRHVTPEEIVERTIYALVNEGAQILDEGHALRASDIDLVYINGYGFPSWRGGPMHYADEVGPRRVYETVREFGWKPAAPLERIAESNSSFSAWDSERSGLRAAAKNAEPDHA